MEQAGLFDGLMLKDAGQKRVLATCDNSTPGWVDQVLELIRWFARQRKIFTADDVRAAAGHLPDPPHDNAWGAAFSVAARSNIIRRCGHTKARHAAAHGRWVGLWCSAASQ